jgi:two-component system, OmpR family, sensor kinase
MHPLGKVDGHTLVCDTDLLLLAVHNTLDNAVKYTLTGDSIELCMSKYTNDVVIQIRDSGIRIPHTEQALIWEELYRANNVLEIPGSGIGLALVKAIIERHDGEVELHSIPEQGTTVIFRLPLE